MLFKLKYKAEKDLVISFPNIWTSNYFMVLKGQSL